MAGELGRLALVLHAHLPWVRHPEHSSFFEESWLFEAITETYLPLLETLERLAHDRVPHRLTISLSPPLLNMLADPLLQERYVRHLESRIELAEREVVRTRHEPAFHELARGYVASFHRAHASFVERRRGNLIPAFGALADAGGVDLTTTAATHAVLPLLAPTPAAVRAQVHIGRAEFRRLLGRDARGLWLPECAYAPGLDAVLADAGVRWFCVDTHGVELASAPPVYGVHAPLYCPAGVAAFGRDAACAQQVWSSVAGYPGDFDYRDFYRDIGFDLDEEDVRPYLPPTGERVATGLKYYRITGATDDKQPYVPAWARTKAALHADHFVDSRTRQLESLALGRDRPPLLTVPFDAELFGHWWYEGPIWLEALCRRIAATERAIRMTTPDEYLDEFPTNQVAEPHASTWGWKGYHEVWLSGTNDWIYRHLHHAADGMVALARRFPIADGVRRRALDQAARELLLAQASDWAFILSRGTVVEYATKRTEDHLTRFRRLEREILADAIDVRWLAAVASADNLFPTLDYRVYDSPG
jgi:1,4-alpha-glucan branching enzyme